MVKNIPEYLLHFPHTSMNNTLKNNNVFGKDVYGLRLVN